MKRNASLIIFTSIVLVSLFSFVTPVFADESVGSFTFIDMVPEYPETIPSFTGTLDDADQIDYGVDGVLKSRDHVLSRSEAWNATKTALGIYGGIPSDAIFAGTSYTVEKTYDTSLEKFIEEKPIVISVGFKREIDEMPIVGSPDIIDLDFGDTESPLTIYKRWRTIEDNGVVPVISVEKALEKFERQDLMLSSTCEDCYSGAKIQNLTLGYFEKGPKYYRITFEPVWIMDGESPSGRKFYNYVYARHFANFTASETDIPTFTTVKFTDTSDANPTEWLWDFGDGTNSTEQNPSHMYTALGNYNVTLKAWNDLGSDTEIKTGYITVGTIKPFIANFTATPRIGSYPLTVNFTDLSDPSPEKWLWDFGDGTTSTDKDPVHTFVSGGNYTVSLTSWNTFANDTVVKDEYIIVYPTPAPVAKFSSNSTDNNGSVIVHFTDESEVYGNDTHWYWDFGDGKTSTEQNPEHVFYPFPHQKEGIYFVTLQVTDNYGRTSTAKSDWISVLKLYIIVDFSGTPVTGNAPLTVRFSDIIDDDRYPNYYLWEFGDGSTILWSPWENPDDALIDPPLHVTHTYAEPGVYSVSMTKGVIVRECNYNSTTRENYIIVKEPGFFPTAEFSANITSGKNPLPVAFTDESIKDVINWSWEFGDGSTSAGQNPVHVYNAPGNYSVSLLVYNINGSDYLQKRDYIRVTIDEPVVPVTTISPLLPVADFDANTTTGKTPLTVGFNDLSINSPGNWRWDFGDGESSDLENPVHTYSATGMYSVTLTVTNQYGNNQTIKLDYITVLSRTPPQAGFIGEPVSGLAPLTVIFRDTSTDSPTTWDWMFGDGFESSEQNPTHVYINPGNYTVILDVTNDDGSDSETKIGYIMVDIPPVPEFPSIIPPAVLVVGLVGTVVWIRRTREQ